MTWCNLEWVDVSSSLRTIDEIDQCHHLKHCKSDTFTVHSKRIVLMTRSNLLNLLKVDWNGAKREQEMLNECSVSEKTHKCDPCLTRNSSTSEYKKNLKWTIKFFKFAYLQRKKLRASSTLYAGQFLLCNLSASFLWWGSRKLCSQSQNFVACC